MTITYTYLEQITKKFKISDAINAAKFILRDKYNINPADICLQHITSNKMKLFTPITVIELNEISDKIVSQTKQLRGIKY